MSILAGFMVPHPPLIIAEVGKGEERKIAETEKAYHKVGRKIAELAPETIVVISPHNAMYRDYIHVRPQEHLQGSFRQFGAPKPVIEADSDLDFIDALCRIAEAGCNASPCWGVLGGEDETLDHGTLVPLSFVNQYYRSYRLVSVGLSGLPLTVHYRLGQAIKETAENLGRRTVVIASGDLSHYLKEDGPYGYREDGPVYDERIMDVMADAQFGKLLEFSDEFCSQAGECGHRAFTILAGALDETAVRAERLSYQDTFGVGYGICTYDVIGKDSKRNFLKQYRESVMQRCTPASDDADAYVALARKSLEYYVTTGRRMDVPEALPTEMTERSAGVFVSIHQDGALRGCIGTIAPMQENIACEIMENAVSAAAFDPRFAPVMPEELSQLVYSVDVLGEPEAIDAMDALDAKRYGVIVTKGNRRGLLLPDLDGVDTPEQQVAIARQKAGIGADEKGVALARFQVIRHGEKG